MNKIVKAMVIETGEIVEVQNRIDGFVDWTYVNIRNSLHISQEK